MIKKPTKKKNKPLMIVAGIALLIFGIRRLFVPTVPHYGMELDLTPFQIPLAIVSTGLGLFFVWNAFSGKPSDD